MTLTTIERIDMAALAHAEGRIIQNKWRKTVDGRELVCALAAFGPDIDRASNCPADLMPRWLAELVPVLDDGIAADQVFWFSGELIARARRWHFLDTAAWDRIRTGFMIASIRQALASAETVQPDPRPDYWLKVEKACNGVITALETGEGLKAAAAVAAAAGVAPEAEATRLDADLRRMIGQDLQCWCPLTSRWCHAAVLIVHVAARVAA